VHLKFNRHKRILMASPPPVRIHKSPFPKEYPHRDLHVCVCVCGRERDQAILVTMVTRALLAWLDCQECGTKKHKKRGIPLMDSDGGGGRGRGLACLFLKSRWRIIPRLGQSRYLLLPHGGSVFGFELPKATAG